MKYIITILVLSFVTPSMILADGKEILGDRGFTSILFFTIGLPNSSGSTDFFSVYNQEFSGRKKDFKLSPLFGGGTKLRFEGNYRIGAQFFVLKSSLKDEYDEVVQTVDQTGNRYYAQTIDIIDIPVIFTAEYMPYTSQFRTYVGGGIGFLMRSMEWLEVIKSNIQLDTRIGGIQFDATEIYPFLKIYSGVELGFDRLSEDHFLGSLVIEASYNYTAGKSDFFETVKRQFVPREERLNQGYNLLPGYIVISLAVTFNFNKTS